ncbi:MAG: gene transfer agent family protein [Paracoccus sp. (in: a-proteobacteria)]|uniref:gene transfer agent family protein n=1 Tax=Paracoccus sp. TaxID=267 RepID=UPI0026DF8791|nr:gene transfer agent family protein [Paracoccus sp. (in: a-proteobacteria)]MDO5621914.1 gene transfer agent family protein [Paracoccus sp. (in: a-proteobacteria)]
MRAAVVVWPGGEHSFRLGIAEFEGLQRDTDCGPEWLARRLSTGEHHFRDPLDVLRWGLIGGGMAPDKAKHLVERALDYMPPSAFKAPALEVLLAGYYGPADDPVGKPSLAGETTPSSESAES